MPRLKINRSQLLREIFERLEKIAAAGGRCPTADQGLKSELVSALANAGKIKVEISTHNWRRVMILVGPHAGKSTAPNPLARSTVYLTIDKSGTRRAVIPLDHGASRRPQLSPPRLLTPGKAP